MTCEYCFYRNREKVMWGGVHTSGEKWNQFKVFTYERWRRSNSSGMWRRLAGGSEREAWLRASKSASVPKSEC
jgi:hypothetical protein